VKRWSSVFCQGLPLLNWKVYTERFLPLVLKMADLSHTPVSRMAAAHIIAATVNIEVEHDKVSSTVLQAYLALCQDTSLAIRKDMLANLHILLPKVRNESDLETLFTEVPAFTM
jgi:hypothetical protein